MSADKVWQDVDIRCPFYRSRKTDNNGCVIRCEGITPDGSLNLRFRRKDEAERHLADYCEGSYIRCEIHEALQRVHSGAGGTAVTRLIPDPDSHFRLRSCGCGGTAEYVGYDTDEWAVRCRACGHEGVRGRLRHDVQIHWNGGGRFEQRPAGRR